MWAELKIPCGNLLWDVDFSDEHFAIDCACGGESGHYGDSDARDNPIIVNRNEALRDYIPMTHSKERHTFLINSRIFARSIEAFSRSNGGASLVIVCDGCGNRFPFTSQSYESLRETALRTWRA